MIIKNRIKFVLTIGAGLFLFSGLSQTADTILQTVYQYVFAGIPAATCSTFIDMIISTLTAILVLHITAKDIVWIRVWPYLHYSVLYRTTDRNKATPFNYKRNLNYFGKTNSVLLK